MQAIILAGGLGTRLKEVTGDIPKPMALVNGRPFLEYVLDRLVGYSFSKVVLAVGYQSQIIINHFGYFYKGLVLDYSIEQELLGTGGSIKQALEKTTEEYVFILNGDTYFEVDFEEMYEPRNKIACKFLRNFSRYGKLEFNRQEEVISFKEKEFSIYGYINGGIYLVSRFLFDSYCLSKKFSFENDFLAKYIQKHHFKSYKSKGAFLDMGIKEDYEKAIQIFQRGKALFLDRDGVVNLDFGYVHQISEVVFVDSIFEICQKYQEKGFQIIIVSNQAGIAKGKYSLKDLNIINNYMVEEFEKRGIHITAIYYCPHKDEDFCGCRKPQPGLFLKALKEYGLAAEKSVMIGDKTSDLEAAYAAGIQKLYFLKGKYPYSHTNFTYKVIQSLKAVRV